MVLNFSSVEFSNLELTILAHGLDNCIPSCIIKCEEVYSKFEVLFAQLRQLQPVSSDCVSDLKVRLNDFAYAYAGTPVSTWESDWRSEHFRTLKSLSSNNSIVITWPYKGSGVVILDYQCYVNKMMSILGDTSKFLRLDPVDSFDHTTSIEIKYICVYIYIYICVCVCVCVCGATFLNLLLIIFFIDFLNKRWSSLTSKIIYSIIFFKNIH